MSRRLRILYDPEADALLIKAGEGRPSYGEELADARAGQIIAAQPTPEAVACALLAQNITKAYIIATANWATPLTVTCQTTTALLETKPIYKNEHYSLLEATLTTTPSQKC